MLVMKKYSVFLIAVITILCWLQNGFADRLHHWVDSKGVTHLSKSPPPEDGKLIEIMDYSSRTDEPAKPNPEVSAPGLEKKNETVAEEKPLGTTGQPAPEIDLAKACYIYANGEEVYVYVVEIDPMTGPQDMLLYQGIIPKDQKQLIKSTMGNIIFTYRRSVDDRSSGDNRADCANGNVVSIP
jgi:hypothetical protein